MNDLDLSKTYKIKTDSSTYYFNFGHSSNGYYINFIERFNSVLFTKYNIKVLLSFDGIPIVQNKQRSNSFNKAINNIPYLLLR